MPVPDYETLMLPVLRLFAEGAKNVAECLPHLRTEFGITDEEAAEMLPSGRVTVLQSRAHWAHTYLSKAGLLESPRRNQHIITARGHEVLASDPSRIDHAFLDRFEGFRDWRARAAAEPVTGNQADDEPTIGGARSEDGQVSNGQTPEDAMAAAHKVMNAALRDDLLALLQTMAAASRRSASAISLSMSVFGLRPQKASTLKGPRATAGIASCFARRSLLCCSIRSTWAWTALLSDTPCAPKINSWRF